MNVAINLSINEKLRMYKNKTMIHQRQQNKNITITFEPRHEKSNILPMRKNKDADQLRGNREADQRLCFRFKDSAIPLLSKSEFSSL